MSCAAIASAPAEQDAAALHHAWLTRWLVGGRHRVDTCPYGNVICPWHEPQRLYGLDARGLRPIHEWLGGFEQFWSESFDRLNEYVMELQVKGKSDATGR